MKSELSALLDSLEVDIDRQRNLAPELKISMLAKLAHMREIMDQKELAHAE